MVGCKVAKRAVQGDLFACTCFTVPWVGARGRCICRCNVLTGSALRTCTHNKFLAVGLSTREIIP